jgi:chitin synthase
MGDPIPVSYVSVEEGNKQHNMAKVFVGLYSCKGRSIPTVLVVKCGTPAEATSPKPGNRGKRDSQMILMNYLQRIIFNETMTPLEYDLFNKMYWLLGVPPDWFSYVLMVDADTRVAVDSLRRMINAMIRDPKIIGLCGETRIANKWQSWVSMIQVFEYYISHHMGKAFESVFGGVTCLPGCFSMYRIKTLKDGHWLPILVHPKLIEEYSTSDVETLHKKNLLLLGEDRYLTTLLIKNFPNRKTIYVPQAYAHTIVPHEFRVLLSQRRRWINSTLHNLLELVQLNNLCGIFCFSMQFVIFIELIATVVLPAAIVFTIILIVTAILNPATALIPMILLCLVLGLPAILIVLTSFRLDYLFWMLIYLLALPVWNFILPIYAYWHFDDFTWGRTHRLASRRKSQRPQLEDGGDEEGKDKAAMVEDEVLMKTWVAWTRLHLRNYCAQI